MEPEGSLACPQETATVQIPRHSNLVYTQCYFLKIYFNIVITSTTTSSKWSLFLRFPHKSLYTPLLSSLRDTYPIHRIVLDLITRIKLGAKYRLWRSLLCNGLYSAEVQGSKWYRIQCRTKSQSSNCLVWQLNFYCRMKNSSDLPCQQHTFTLFSLF